MKKILILGANSYIGTSFEKYISANYPGKYEIRRTSLRGTAWQQEDWSSYDSILNVTGKAHADIASLTEEQKREYYTVNCDLAVEAAKKAIAAGAGQYIYQQHHCLRRQQQQQKTGENYRRYETESIEFLWRQQMAGGTATTGTVRGQEREHRTCDSTTAYDLRCWQ